MKILVCIAHVPDTASKIAFTDNDSAFDKHNVQFIMGPYDDYALARAVEFKKTHAAEVTVLNVGTAETEPTIRKALAIGADKAIRVNANPTDSLFVAVQIAAIAKKYAYDLILMGRESIDFNGGQVHGMVGEILEIPSFSSVMTLHLDGETAKISCELEGGKAILEAKLPLVLGCQEPIAEWKIPNMRGIITAKSKPMEVVEPKNMETATKNIKFETPPPKKAIKFIDPKNIDELVRLLKEEVKII